MKSMMIFSRMLKKCNVLMITHDQSLIHSKKSINGNFSRERLLKRKWKAKKIDQKILKRLPETTMIVLSMILSISLLAPVIVALHHHSTMVMPQSGASYSAASSIQQENLKPQDLGNNVIDGDVYQPSEKMLRPSNNDATVLSSSSMSPVTENTMDDSQSLDSRDPITRRGKGGPSIKLAGTVAAEDAFEDNDDFASSKQLNMGYTFRPGSPLGDYLVGNESDPDYFNITLPAGYYFMIEIRYNSSEVNFDLFLYEAPNETALIYNSTSPSSTDSIGGIYISNIVTFYIKIIASYSQVPNGLYPYELDIFLEDEFGANPTDFSLYNNETTPEDAIELPNSLVEGDVYENLTIPNLIRGNDTFQFIAWETNVVNITISIDAVTVNSASPVILLAVYYSNQSILDSAFMYSIQVSRSITFTVNSSEWYYIRVQYVDTNASQVFYTLYLTIEDQFDGFTHANNGYASAPVLNNSHQTWTFTGQWASSTYPDYYRIQLEDAERIKVDLFYFSGIYNQLDPRIKTGINLYFFNDSSMTQLIVSSVSTKDSESFGTIRVDRAGTFYLFVNSTIPGLRYYNMTVTILGADDDFEENDSFSDAKQLPTDPGTYDLFLIKTEYDTFVITLGRGDLLNVTITFNSSKGNLDLYIYSSLNPSLPLAVSNDVSASKESVTYFNTEDVFHVFILINAPSGGGIAGIGMEYTLIIDVSVGDDHFEPNDDFNSAVPLGEGNNTGLLVRALDEDWYKIYLFPGEQVNISVGFSNANGDIDLYAVDKTNGLIVKSVTNNDIESVRFIASYEGLYYIRVTLFSGSVNSYWISVSYPDENLEPSEDNDVRDAAYPLGQGLHQNLSIRIGDDDYYAINITQPSQAIVVFASYDHSRGDLILELYHPNGSMLASDELFGSNVDYIPATAFPNPDTYYLVVKLQDEPGFIRYNLNITIAAASKLIGIPPISFVPFPPLTTLTPTSPVEGLDLIFAAGVIGAGATIGAAAAGGGFYAFKKIQSRKLSDKKEN